MKTLSPAAGLALLALLAFTPGLAPAQTPGWWSQYGIVNAAPARDYSPAAIGQLRYFSQAAIERLLVENEVMNGVNLEVRGLNQTSVNLYLALRGLSAQATPPNFQAANCGQVRNFAQNLYQNTVLASTWPAAGQENANHPINNRFINSAVTARDFAPANNGQLKNAFNFEIGLPAVRQFPPVGVAWNTAPWAPAPINDRVERERKFRITAGLPAFQPGLTEGEFLPQSGFATNALTTALTNATWAPALSAYKVSRGSTAFTYSLGPGDPDEQWFVDIYYDTPDFLNYRNYVASRTRIRFDELFANSVPPANFNPLTELSNWLKGQTIFPERIEFQTKVDLRTGYNSLTGLPVGGAAPPAADGYYEVRQYRDFFRPGSEGFLSASERTGSALRSHMHRYLEGKKLAVNVANMAGSAAFRWNEGIANVGVVPPPAPTNAGSAAAAGLIDGVTDTYINLINGIAGDTTGAVDQWLGAGVTFPSPQTISAVEFTHGSTSTNRGFFISPAAGAAIGGLRVQFAFNGAPNTWLDDADAAWSTPIIYPAGAYASNSTMADKNILITGPARSDVVGVRIIGRAFRNTGPGQYVAVGEFRAYRYTDDPSASTLGYLTWIYGNGIQSSSAPIKLAPKAIVISQRKRTRLRTDAAGNNVRNWFRTELYGANATAPGGEILLMTLDIAHVFDPVVMLSRMQNTALTPPDATSITTNAAAWGRIGQFVEIEFQIDEEWSPPMTSVQPGSAMSAANREDYWRAMQSDLFTMSSIARNALAGAPHNLTIQQNFVTKYQEALQTVWLNDVNTSVISLGSSSAARGSMLTVNGKRFDPLAAGNVVKLYDPANPTVVQATVPASTSTGNGASITFQVPPGIAVGQKIITVTSPAGVGRSPTHLTVQ